MLKLPIASAIADPYSAQRLRCDQRAIATCGLASNFRLKLGCLAKAMLNAGTLRHAAARLDEINADMGTRVKVFTVSGVQIGIPGVGEGDNRLTFPRTYLVGEVLQVQWIRFATEAEKQEAAKSPTVSALQTWWRYSEVQPLSLAHCSADGLCDEVASPEQHMGLVGNQMLALAQNAVVRFENKPCADVDDIPTPPTP